MSIMKTIAVVEAPESVRLQADGTVARELSERRGFACPQCNGSGYVMGEDGRGGLVKSQCDACMGYGMLKARILVEWLPDNPVKY